MRVAHHFGLAGLLLLGLFTIGPEKASALPGASGGVHMYKAQSDVIQVRRRSYRRRHYRPYRYYYRPYGYYRPYRYYYRPYGYYRPYRNNPYYYGGPGIGLYFRF